MKLLNSRFKCILWVVLCAFVVSTCAQPASRKNETDKEQKTDGKPLKGSDTIVRPTNVFKGNDGTVSNEASQNVAATKQTSRDLRPFEWLYKHLGEYLMCAYSEHGDCEKQLTRSLRKEERNTLTSARKYPDLTEYDAPFRRSQQPFSFGRSMGRFRQFPSQFPEHSAPQPFTGHERQWAGPNYNNEQRHEYPVDYVPPNDEFTHPRLLWYPYRRHDKPRELRYPPQPEFPHQPEYLGQPDHPHQPDYPRQPEQPRQPEYPRQAVPPQFNEPPMAIFPHDFRPFTDGIPQLNEGNHEPFGKYNNKKAESDAGKWPKNISQRDKSYPAMMQNPLMGLPIFAPYP